MNKDQFKAKFGLWSAAFWLLAFDGNSMETYPWLNNPAGLNDYIDQIYLAYMSIMARGSPCVLTLSPRNNIEPALVVHLCQLYGDGHVCDGLVGSAVTPPEQHGAPLPLQDVPQRKHARVCHGRLHRHRLCRLPGHSPLQRRTLFLIMCDRGFMFLFRTRIAPPARKSA